MSVIERDGETPGETCYYSVEKLWSIAGQIDEVVKVAVFPFLKRKSWLDVRGRCVSPLDVLRDLKNPLYVQHRCAIEAANFDYPVLIADNTVDCYDGLHRMAKAHMAEKLTVKAKVINAAQLRTTLVERFCPKVVHVSWSATLDQPFEDHRVAVYNLESFFTPGDAEKSGYNAADDEQKEAIRDEHFRVGFERAMWDSQAKDVVIFIGLLEHGSPSGRRYEHRFDAQFYPDIPLPQLIRAYYKRVARDLDDDQYLASVTPPGTRAICEPRRIAELHVVARDTHIKRGYVLLPPDEIQRRIEQMYE